MGFTKAQLQGELKRRAQLELQKRHARQYLADFTLYTYPTYLMGWFHREVCEALDKFLADVLAKKSPRLILTAPPRHGKSELVSRRFPAFAFGRCPDLQIIATSYGADLAQRFNRDVQRIIDDDTYRTLFPETTLNGRNVRTDSRNAFIRTSDLFEIVNHKGAYRSCGVGGGITGTGADILIIDDPIKDRAEANSPTVRANVYDWYTSTAYTRLSPGGGVIVMNTRWHPIKDDTPVLTTSGWKQHGDLQVGDQVFGLEGKPVAVTKVWPPVMCTAKAVTRTETIVCGDTHLWPVKSSIGDNYANQQTSELIKAGGAYILPHERGVTFAYAEPEECGWGRCITTSAPDGIYLVGKTLMPTHNCFDLAGQLIDKMNAEDGDKWQVINYPAIAEHDEPHRKAGEPLHADRYPLEAVNDFSLTGSFLSFLGAGQWEALFLCNPNNPTGQTISHPLLEEILDLCQKKHMRLFVDECFLDLTDGGRDLSLKSQLKDHPELFILKAFTKSYGMAGLRLGYCLSADSELLRAMGRTVQPWNVSLPAQAAGVAALGEREFLRRTRAVIHEERAWLREQLAELGLQVFPSRANYLLVRGRPDLCEKLLERGILARSCANYHGLGPEYLRLAVKRHEENETLIATLQNILKES